MYRLLRITDLRPPTIFGRVRSPAAVMTIDVNDPQTMIRLPQGPLEMFGIPVKVGSEFLWQGRIGSTLTPRDLKLVIDRNPDMWR